jgi:antitoxin component of RelBE/YafQ-DinJ toxin-antitoxin module
MEIFLVDKCVPMGYTCGIDKKNVALKIRVEEELRREFIEVCRAEDMTAAQVVRQFMREYIKTAKIKIKTGQE